MNSRLRWSVLPTLNAVTFGLGAVLLCANLAMPARAGVIPDPVVPATDIEEQSVGGFAVVNAGAGKEEVAALQRMASRYNLRVVISGRGGEYGVADRLLVSGPNGVRVEIVDAGPWLLMRLPPGRYTLDASFGGRAERRTAIVGSGHTIVHWNTPAASG